MPRKVRIEFPGAKYHVMSRGDRREDIFQDDVDRQDFIRTLAEACQKTDWQVHAYCLMPNHFHLVVETPNGNLVAGMRWLLSAYTIRLNQRHKLAGHVFSGRYKAQIIDGQSPGYLRVACDYVHLNPVRARMLDKQERLASYPWSSLGYHLCAPRHRPQWIRSQLLLGEHGIRVDSAAGRQKFERLMEKRRSEKDDDEQLSPLKRGWYLGSDAFRKELVRVMEGKLKGHHMAEVRRESARDKAGRILSGELKRRGLKLSDLACRRKSDPEKLAIAARVRKETTLSIKEIAMLLSLGTYNTASVNLHQWMKQHKTTGTKMSKR
jgi:REP element-mobilizing transposase RayT